MKRACIKIERFLLGEYGVFVQGKCIRIVRIRREVSLIRQAEREVRQRVIRALLDICREE